MSRQGCKMKKYRRPDCGKLKVIYDANCPPNQMYVYLDEQVVYIYPRDAPRIRTVMPGWTRG